MATPPKITRSTSHDLVMIGVRLLDDAHMTWVAAEVESEHALGAWFDADAPQSAGAYLAYRAQRSTASRRQAATSSGCLS